MTAAEARQRAAQIALERLASIGTSYWSKTEGADWPAIEAELRLVETWLRRRAVGQDKLTVKQMERPTGRQVAASPKQAKRLGIPDK